MARWPSALGPLRQVLSSDPPETMLLLPWCARWSSVAGANPIRDAGAIEPGAKHFGEVALGRGFHSGPQFFVGHFVSRASPHDLLKRRPELVTGTQLLQRHTE